MKLEKWALIAEIFSAIAVVASLVFVGLQIRQGAEETALNTQAVQIGAYQDLTAQNATLNTLLIENPQFAALDERVLEGEEPETPTERAQMTAYLRLMNRHGELAFRQYENDLIDEPSLISMLGPVRGHLTSQFGRDLWTTQFTLNPRYRDYVDGLGYSDVFSQWEDAWNEFAQGNLSRDDLPLPEWSRGFHAVPDISEDWESNKDNYAPEFVQFVEENIVNR